MSLYASWQGAYNESMTTMDASFLADHYTRPDLERAALLSIDVQRDVLDGPLSFASPTRQLPNLRRLIEAFRVTGGPIVHVVRLYLPDGSNADLCRRDAIDRGHGALLAGTPGSALVDELLPRRDVALDVRTLLSGGFQHLTSNETVMYKPRWGAFYGTRLLEHLRACGVATVVVAGCNFPNCPRATIFEASERDMRVVAVSDALSRFTDRDAAEMRDIGVEVMPAIEVAGHVRVGNRCAV
jgi:nicotinamidase-related amidase